MIPEVKPLITGEEMVSRANEAHQRWCEEYTANFLAAFKGHRMTAKHPLDAALGSRARVVEGEIYDAFFNTEGDFDAYIEFWDDEKSRYLLAQVGV